MAFPPDIFPALIVAFTVSELKVPTLVILGCAAVVNVPVNDEAPIVPELAYTLPDVVLPATAKFIKVPTLVKLLVIILELNVVPVKLAALAVITVLLAEVNCPC